MRNQETIEQYDVGAPGRERKRLEEYEPENRNTKTTNDISLAIFLSYLCSPTQTTTGNDIWLFGCWRES